MNEIINNENQYVIGIEVIDNEHEKICELLQGFEDLSNGKVFNNQLESLINTLVDTTLTHFRTEEYLMKKANYPKIEEHRNEHRLLLKRLENIKKNYSAKGEYDMKLASKFIGVRIKRHLLIDDKLMGDFITDHSGI